MKASPAVLLLLLACATAPPPPPPGPSSESASLPGCGDESGEGEEGGVEGGVAGGVVGGGGRAPLFLPPSVGRAQIAADLKDQRHRPRIPADHARPGATYWALFKICVSDAGEVTNITTLKSTCVAEIDDAWAATIKSWSHHPYQRNGNRRPFCYPMRLQLSVPKAT